MKKNILAVVTVAGAMMASAPFAKANAFLEVISGGASHSTTVLGNLPPVVSLSTGVGSWSTTISTGDSSDIVSFDLGVQANGNPVTGPLTVVFQMSYLPSGGLWDLNNFISASFGSSAGSVSETATVYYGPALNPVYNPANLGALGTVLNTETQTAPSDYMAGGLLNPILGTYTMVVTVTPTFTRGHGVQISIDNNFDINTSLPDGGTTVAMLGSVLIGLAGFRSKFSKRS